MTRRFVLPPLLVVVAVLLTSGAGERRGDNRPSLALQVALDRSGISPGIIDGRLGARTRDAVALYQRAHRLAPSNTVDPSGADLPGLAIGEPTITYKIMAEDVAGPFAEIPKDLMEQGSLPALDYSSAAERIAERFHTDVDTLRWLNPSAQIAEGESIRVPNVEPLVLPTTTARRKEPGAKAAGVQYIVVSRQPPQAVVMGTGGEVLFAAPVTSGSEHDPLPIGEWKVLDVYLNPVFRYNPALFWDADPSHAKTTIKPGPNNPVGLAWIDIDREHYGLHGTPEPQTVGHTSSHGCVRFTNWDIVRLVEFVKPGMRIVFDEHLPEIAPATH
jgi:lipoprotein-anchoring transpeptidase ErfK/SrfK